MKCQSLLWARLFVCGRWRATSCYCLHGNRAPAGEAEGSNQRASFSSAALKSAPRSVTNCKYPAEGASTEKTLNFSGFSNRLKVLQLAVSITARVKIVICCFKINAFVLENTWQLKCVSVVNTLEVEKTFQSVFKHQRAPIKQRRNTPTSSCYFDVSAWYIKKKKVLHNGWVTK